MLFVRWHSNVLSEDEWAIIFLMSIVIYIFIFLNIIWLIKHFSKNIAGLLFSIFLCLLLKYAVSTKILQGADAANHFMVD